MKFLRLVPFVLLVLSGPLPAKAAQPGFGPWAGSEQAQVRLVAAGIGDDGKLAAGIEIMLEPGWWTYWRTPGAAGIPPVIDFTRSENAGSFVVGYPLPERHDDGYGVSNVYEGGVLLPVWIEVPDPAAPVDLRLSLNLGVCREVCIPEQVETTLTIEPGMRDRVAGATLAGARARVPGPPQPGMLDVTGARRSGGDDKRPVFDIDIVAPEDVEIFVEGPADWFPGMPERIEAGSPTFRVTFDRLGAKSPIEGASLRVTLAADGKAVETTVPIE